MEDGLQEEGEAMKTFRQTVSAMKYCHSLGIVRRGRKPSFPSDMQGVMWIM